MPKFTLSVDNEKIWNFYKQNPSLNFETVNLMFIDLMKQLIPDSSTGLTSSLAEQLIENMKTMQSQLNGVTENISSLRNDNLAHLTIKLSEFKKDYLDDVKMILSNNVSDKIAPLLREQNEMALNSNAFKEINCDFQHMNFCSWQNDKARSLVGWTFNKINFDGLTQYKVNLY